MNVLTRRLAGFTFLAVVLCGSWTSFAQATDDAVRQKLDVILGTVSDWQLSRYQGSADDFKLIDADGQPVLVGGPNAAVFSSVNKVPADSEVTIRLRLGAAGGKQTSVYCGIGFKTLNEPNQGPLFLSLYVVPAAEQETVVCQMPPLPGQSQGIYFPYSARLLPKNRLTWPEMVRSRVEQDFASVPTLGQRWLTLRYVIRKDSAQVFVDGRLIRDAHGIGIEPEGHLRLTVFEGSQLASIRIRKLPPEDPFFEPVALDHHVNASSSVTRSVSEAGTTIGGVPFLIVNPDARGHDHVDVGRSWMRFGLLEGQYDPWAGEVTRWTGLVNGEAGRICFRVRNRPYSKLHLLAAFDGELDKTPVVSAQFYRHSNGHPVHFSARVPLFTAKSDSVAPVKMANGSEGNLHLVTILLEPEGLTSFADLEFLDFELTKEVHVYRAFPDPCYYSQHGAGLPSGVRVFGLTLERPAVEVDFQPDRFAHIWTAPETPFYSIALTNRSSQPQAVKLELSTISHDGTEKTKATQEVTVATNWKQTVKLPFALKRYGYHEVKLVIQDAQGTRTQTRSLAYLHPDTRERGNWEEGKGPLWGMWDWNGGHETTKGLPRIEVAYAAGIESAMRPLFAKDAQGSGEPPDELALMQKYGWQTHYLAYQTSLNKGTLGVDFDPSKPAEMEAKYIEAIRKTPYATPSGINRPELALFWAEPIIGNVSVMSLPENYGDPPYQMTEAEQASYKSFLDQFVIGARAIKKTWPNAKCYMPWGISSFPIPFLKHSKEATELMDGPAVDQVLFERPPEMQLHQVTFASTLWQFKQAWVEAGKKWPPKLITIEGGGLPSPATPGGLTQDQEADHSIRGELLLCAFGVTRHLGWPSLFRCAGAWGEQHYGGGLIERLPLNTPKVAFAAHAAMTRQLNRMNYVKTIDTGSTSVFCLQFQHYKTGELLHVIWTLRGKRPISLSVPAGAKIVVFDQMDNPIELTEQGGLVTFNAKTSVSYVRGLTANAKMTLGEPDHRDSKTAPVATRLGNLGDGSWKISEERDNDYETVHIDFVKKFPSKMTVQSVASAAEYGGKALSVHLEPPVKERRTMPFYTTLVPEKPITLAGKPSHLGLWVNAASDWGRVVYCLRDANGERWLSTGKKGEWNVDDTHCWSAFNFDGWRYLRFELPGNQPWDCYRDAGSSFWGNFGDGDGIVDLPLSLEKIIVERRTHVIKADDLIPANPADVLLADLAAEYATEVDRTDETVRLSRLRMPQPKEAPALDNPIQKLTETGIGAPSTITKVTPPEREYDGTRCHVFFDAVAGAKSYDIWVSTYADGRGAIKLATGWTQSGQLLTGLPSNTALHLFVTSIGADDKPSKPSAAKRILLKDDFPFK
jgi:hypothetical protein